MTYAWLTEEVIDRAWARFVAKVSAFDPLGCWLWTGAKSRGQGNTAWYGSFKVEWRGVRAHIFAAAAAGLDVPSGHHRDHTCRNTLCVNPAHLEPVTPTENNLRRWSPWRAAA